MRPWLALLLFACTSDDDPIPLGGPPGGDTGDVAPEDRWDWAVPPGFPLPVVPAENPMTPAKVALGRHLFYDERLSGNGTQACASCHEQSLAFAAGQSTVPGSTGEAGHRNPMALVNVAYNSSLTWGNPVLESLEQQILVPLFGDFPVELGAANQEAEIWARLMDDPVYTELFAEAFPDEPEASTRTVVHGLASFVRSLISADSPYDRYASWNERDALSPAARRGLGLFFDERFECHHCHGSFNFTLSTASDHSGFVEKPFHNTGLYNLGDGAYPAPNTGVFEITGEPSDMGRFKAPTLRNVAVTAPYMHDGSVRTLEEVLDIYARGGRLIEEGPFAGDGALNPYKSGFVSGFTMTDDEKADLLAFLESLTDEAFLTDPAHADPW